MKIGIDARFIGPEGTGLGKYTEKLIENLAKIDPKNHYVVFLRQNNLNYLKLNKNFSKVLADVPWYSLKEQFKMPAIFQKSGIDLLHVPHFNVPIFYRGKFVVTIHDLIHHQFSQESATTHNPLIFKIKRFAYHYVINHAIKNSQKILTPSNFVKNEIIKTFRVSPSKVTVTYEAAEEEYVQSSKFLEKFSIKKPFLIYVGNAYPHKNLERLLEAFKILKTHNSSLIAKLLIVCPRDVFWKRLKEKIKEQGLEDQVIMTGYIPAKDLSTIFRQAEVYVFPSLSEGFGIPGLNAMAAKIPVVCSNIPTLKEIYDSAALFFDPDSPDDIASKIDQVLKDEKIRSDLVKKGLEQAKKYSWLKMTQETIKVYKEVE